MAEAPESDTEKSIAALDKTRFADGAIPVAELRLKLQQEMQDHAAVYRTQETLAEGVVSFWGGDVARGVCTHIMYGSSLDGMGGSGGERGRGRGVLISCMVVVLRVLGGGRAEGGGAKREGWSGGRKGGEEEVDIFGRFRGE